MPRASRDALIRVAVSVCVGLAGSFGLWQALHRPPTASAPASSRVPIRMASVVREPAPPPVAPPEPAPLALRATVASPRKLVPPPAVQPQKNSVAQQEPPAPAAPLATIEQPALYSRSPASNAPRELPLIPASEAPAAPPEPETGAFSLASAVRPGGTAMVLGVLVDDQGIAMDTRILVTSQYPLQDVSAAMANLGRRWFDLSPPLQPGENRWLELLIDHGQLHPQASPIP